MPMTIKDIAEEAGCAVSTVSRVLNNHPDVSAEAKKKVGAIVAAHGFVPNSNARLLKQQKSRNIIILVKGSFNMFFAAIVEQMQNLISAAGYNAVMHYLNEEDNEVLLAQQLCRESKPLGLIFLGGSTSAFNKDFEHIKVPSVLATGMVPGLRFKNLSCVCVDDAAAGRQAVDYLFHNGHTHIGVIGGRADSSDISALRREGCLQSFAAHGVDFTEDHYQSASFNYGSAYNAMNKLLAKRADLTAVFCMSDIMAVGAMRAIRDSGRRVPEDISVIGFDGLELAGYYDPKLATIQQPQQELASKSVALLLSHIEHHAPAQEVLVGVSLIEGGSVRSI